MKQSQNPGRIIIEHVKPEIDCGQYPAKRTVGEPFQVEADVFGEGHDEVKACLLYRKSGRRKWQEEPMRFMMNDHWEGIFIPGDQGTYEYTIQGWTDHFSTWQHDLKKKFEAEQDIRIDLLTGADIIEKYTSGARATDRKKLQSWIREFRDPKQASSAVHLALSDEVTGTMNRAYDRSGSVTYEKTLKLKVERKRALFSSWYEFFPRSTGTKRGEHGSFRDAERILPEIAAMGFDIVYLPPIHPIGESFRKGRNNSVTAEPGEPGSPWAIGSKEGGHKSIHAELGTLSDFKSFVKKANQLNIEVALDYAIQCSQDHPYVKEHPEWFRWRPDGTVQYAENPPKKYQDVLPVNFETEDWKNLWEELKSIVEFWIAQGVTVFRVDNPHTKPFQFWEWLIGSIHAKHPDIIFLSEAFTRPRIMEQLAKAGFTQSYTYYTWRVSREELTEYMKELTTLELRDYFRPNFWPNTPDILPVHIQKGGEPAMIARVVMAGTLSSNYGIYGPVYEFGINTPVAPGKEEYLDSEKYEVKNWDFSKKTKIKETITRLNEIRKENPALQATWNIRFADTDNKELIAYAKRDDEGLNHLLIIVNLDPQYVQSGWVQVPLDYLNIEPQTSYKVHDLMTGNRYNWQNERNYIELNPKLIPAHIFRIEH